MVSTESVSSIIAKPNIITMSYKLESRSNIRVMNDPSCCTAKKAMLEKYNRCSWFSILVTCHSVYSKNIAIGGSYEMLFIYKSSILNYFFKSLIEFSRFFSWSVSRSSPVYCTIIMLSYRSKFYVFFLTPNE